MDTIRELVIKSISKQLLFSKKGTHIEALLEKQFDGVIPQWIIDDFAAIEQEIHQEKQILKLQLYNQLYDSLLQPEETKSRTLTKTATSVHEITTTKKPVNIPQEIIVHLLNTTLGRGDITSDVDIVYNYHIGII